MSIKTSALLFCILAVAFSARILPWGEPILSYPNKGWCNQVDLFFQLETALPAGHILRVTLPFGTLPPQASTWTVWSSTPGSRTTLAIATPTTGDVQSALAAPYQPTGSLHTYLRFAKALTANNPYQLRLVVPVANNFSDNTGFLGWVQLETLSPALSLLSSSGTDGAITYDINNAFAPIHFLDTPATSTQFSTAPVTSGDANAVLSGASYLRQFRVTVANNFWLFPLIRFTWDNAQFQLGLTNNVPNVTNVDTGLSTTTTPLASSSYQVVVSTLQINIFHGATLSKTLPVIYNIVVNNPTVTGTTVVSTIPTVYVMHRWNFNLTDYAAGSAFSVNPSTNSSGGSSSSTGCQIAAPKVLLSWGLDRGAFDTTNKFWPKIFQIHARIFGSPAFQVLRFVFGINSTLPSATYTVTVQVCSATAGVTTAATLTYPSCDVLENSVVTSFGSAATCVWTAPTASVAGTIACSNVATIAPSNNIVAARAAFLATGSWTGNGNPVTPASNTGSFSAPSTGGTYYITSGQVFGSILGLGVISIAQSGTSTVPCATSSGANSTYNAAIGSGFTDPTANNIWAGNNVPILFNVNGNGPLIAWDPNTATNGWGGTGVKAAGGTLPANGFTYTVDGTTNNPLFGAYGTNQTTSTVYNLALVSTLNPNSNTATATPCKTGNTATQLGNVLCNWFQNAAGASVWDSTAANCCSEGLYPRSSTNMLTTTGTACANTGANPTITTAASMQGGGFDLYLNPNVWIDPGQASQACYWNQVINGATAAGSPIGSGVTLATGTATVPALLACTSVVYSGTATYTRVRSIIQSQLIYPSVAATAGGVAFATSQWKTLLTPDITANPIKATVFGFEQSVRLSGGFQGTSIRADTYVNEIYAATYVATLASGVSVSSTDIGDLGYTNFTSDGSACFLFFAQYILLPPIIGTTASVKPAGVSIWISGWYAAVAASQTADSNSGLLALRIRGSLNSTNDIFSTSAGRVGLFIRQKTPVAGPPQVAYPLNYVPPAGTTVGTTLTYPSNHRCVGDGQNKVCTAERPLRMLIALKVGVASAAFVTSTGYWQPDNVLDGYQVFSGPIGSTNGFSLALFLQPQTFGNAATNNYQIRFASIAGTMYYIYPQDSIMTNDPAGAVGTYILTAQTSTSCSPVSTSPVNSGNGPRFIPATSDIVNSNISSTLFNIQSSTTPSGTGTQGGWGHLIYCTQWQWSSSTSAIQNATAYANSTVSDACTIFDYQSIEGSSSSWYCLWCPLLTPVTTTASSIYVTNVRSAPTVDLTTPTFYVIAADGASAAGTAGNAAFSERGYCTTTSFNNMYQPGPATVTSTGSGWSAQGQKIVVTFSSYSTFSKNPAVSSFSLNGILNATGFAADTAFPYGSLDTAAAVAYWVPSSQVNNFSAYQQVVSLPSSTSGGSWSFNVPTIATAYQTNANWVLVIWGYNGITQTNNQTLAYYWAKTVAGSSSKTVDQSPLNASSSIWNLTTINTNLIVSGIAYQRPFLNARGYFRWDFSFPVTRNWYTLDKLGWNLDAAITSSANSNTSVVKCRITDQQDNTMQNFQSCTLFLSATTPNLQIVSLPAATLNVLDFAATSGYRVYLDNMVTLPLQNNRTVWGSLIFSGSTTGSTASLTRFGNATDVVLSALTTVSTTGITFKSFYKGIGEQQDIWFTLTTAQPLNDTCRIVVIFPSYYQAGLDVRGTLPYCSVNGVQVYCYIPDNNRRTTLYVESFSQPQSANATFLLKISGVSAPTTTNYIAENFWVQINQDKLELNTATITSGTTVADTTYSLMTIAPIHVTWSSQSSTTTRAVSTNTWVFTLLNNTVAANTMAVQLIFPDSWGIGWGNGNPICRIYDYTVTSMQYTGQVTPTGNQVYLNLTNQLPSNGLFVVECQGVRTPDQADTWSYPTQDIQIRIIDANATNVYYRSAPVVHNVNYAQQYTKSAGITTISWATAPTGGWTIIRGTYSVALTLLVPGRASKPLTVTAGSSNFGFWTNPFIVPYGFDTLPTLLGCASSLPQNYFQVWFQLNDTTAYTVPSSIWVFVSQTKVTVSTSPVTTTDITMPYVQGVTSNSLPMVIDLTNNRPFADVAFTPTFSTLTGQTSGQANTNFTVVPSSLSLTPAQPVGSFVYYTTGSTLAPTATNSGGSVIVTYAISGTNANAYQFASTQNVRVVLAQASIQTTTPTLTVAIDSSDQGLSVTKVLSLTLGAVSTATISWVSGLLAQTPSTQNAVFLQAMMPPAKFSAYDVKNPAQIQFGQMQQTQGSTTVTLTNLIPGNFYEFRAYATSQVGQNSTQAYIAFATATNGALITKWIYNYTNYPTWSQRQTLFCTLVSQLQVPSTNVIGINGDYCGNSTTFYNGTNSTGDIGVFFYPMAVNQDSVMTQSNLAATLNSTTSNVTVNNLLTQNGGVGYFNILPLDATIRNTQLTATVSGAASAGTTWISVTGMLNDTGYIYVALDTGTSSTPSPQALRWNGNNGAGSYSFLQYQSIYYQPYFQAGNAVTVNFTGLTPATSYNIYAIGQDNDPSIFANYTGSNPQTPTVVAVPVKTASPTPATTNAVALATTILVALLSILSLLMI